VPIVTVNPVMLWIPRSVLSKTIDITEAGLVIVQVFEIINKVENTAFVRGMLVEVVIARGSARKKQIKVITLDAKPFRPLEAKSTYRVS